MQVQTVAPLGSLRFQAAPRQLPPVKSITLSSSTETSGSIPQILKTATEKGQQGTSTLDVLLDAHEQLQATCNNHASVSFSGVESGDIKASITSVKGPNEASITGLEDTAKLGKGWGIEAFQPRSPRVPSLHSDAMSAVGSRTGRSCHGFITAWYHADQVPSIICMSLSMAQATNGICKLVCSEQVPIMSHGCTVWCHDGDDDNAFIAY